MALNWFLTSGFLAIFEGQEGCYYHRSKGAKESGKLEARPSAGGFEMPLHYPRYSKSDYEKMEEWKVDMLLQQYGLSCEGSVDHKRAFAMGAFLWPDQL